MDCLDSLEGYIGPGNDANHYHRLIRPVADAGGATVEAWVYLASHRCRLGAPIPSGDWTDTRRATAGI